MIDKIKCPNCAHQFDVEQALAGKLEAQFKQDLERKVAEQAARFNREKEQLAEAIQKQQAELAQRQEEFAQAKAKENELFNKSWLRRWMKSA